MYLIQFAMARINKNGCVCLTTAIFALIIIAHDSQSYITGGLYVICLLCIFVVVVLPTTGE